MNQLSHTINFDYVDLQSVAQELSSINWQMAFDGTVQVDDLVAVFMRILYAALHRALFPPRRRSKKPQLLRHIWKLIIRKRRLWKKVRDETCLDTYRASCREVRIAVRSYVSSREQQLLDNPSSTRFYSYINNNIGRPRQPVRLLDSADGIIAAGHDTAEAFNAEFTKNFARVASASGVLHEVLQETRHGGGQRLTPWLHC
jgi:hypothetical protein